VYKITNKKSFSINEIDGVPKYVIHRFKPKNFEYALVIPVLNENERLASQLRRIQSLSPDVDVIIADGGSDDGSTKPEHLQSLGVSSLLVKTGKGKLSAQLRMAFHYCLKAGYKGVITMDGNNKDGELGIIKILDALILGSDFVQGSRFIEGGHAENTPKSRYFAIKYLHAPMVSVAARFRFSDTTNGFRGHSSGMLKDPKLSIFREIFDTYELLAYLPIQASRKGFKVREVPVSRVYPSNDEIPTKIKGIKGYWSVLAILVKAVLNKYAP
jgi:dolichol-phosphate mannosyltransferase